MNTQLATIERPDDPPTRPAPRKDVERVGKPLTPGERVGEYRVEEMMARGGCAAVYLGVHPFIGKRAAIKVLDLWLSQRRDTATRFLTEARAVNQINHPNIVDVFGFGKLPDGRLYCVMELLEGMSLSEFLKRYGTQTVSAVVTLLEPLADAIDAAHARGVVHRDLKPDNILLVEGDDGRIVPKLIDFGVAKLLLNDGDPSATQQGAVIGTPGYMSPEQCRGLDIDSRTDIYALGVIAYQMITGRHPFVHESGLSPQDIMAKHLYNEPTRPSRIRPSLSALVDQALMAMLAKEPAERPSLRQSVALLRKAATRDTALSPVLLRHAHTRDRSSVAGAEAAESVDAPHRPRAIPVARLPERRETTGPRRPPWAGVARRRDRPAPAPQGGDRRRGDRARPLVHLGQRHRADRARAGPGRRLRGAVALLPLELIGR